MSTPLHPPSSRRSTTALRTFALWLCVLAMLGGTVDFHTLADGHGAADLLPPPAAEVADGTLFTCADGHTPATHVEAARSEEAHRCEACVHRQQHRHGELLASGFNSADHDAGSAPSTDLPASAAALLEHAPSRGPPAA